MTRKLPKYYQINEWNKTFNDENKQLIDIQKTKQFGSKLKEQLLGKYNSECDTTGCFSCNEVKRQYKEKMRKKEEEWESKKEEREKMKEKEDKAWREYFGMTLSQATKYAEEKEKRINEEYEKLMQTEIVSKTITNTSDHLLRTGTTERISRYGTGTSMRTAHVPTGDSPGTGIYNDIPILCKNKQKNVLYPEKDQINNK